MLSSLRTVVMFCALIAGAPLAWPDAVPLGVRPALFGALLLAAILSSVEPFIDAVRVLRRAPAQVAAGIFCPRCGAPMMERVARHGRNAGLRFLRCTRFPLCRGTRSARSHRSIE
ncbi:MAG TPA: hypothetical protein VLW75_08080 [Rhizomicrobium sp.]|nr:hypothetical protein [Rhizomicrobium sp.]